MNLLLLAPEIQERVLTGSCKTNERALRRMVQLEEWSAQGAAHRSRG